MKNIIFFSALIICMASACNKETTFDKDTYEYFQAGLKADMKYNAIVDLFGTPDDDIGSGIHIYVYKLKDGTSIYIGYTDKIMYAKHMDASGNLIHQFI